MRFSNLVLYITLGILIFYIAKINNLLGVKQATNKAKKDTKKAKKLAKKRTRKSKLLDLCKYFYDNIGFNIGLLKIEDYEYKISRLEMKLNYLDRAPTVKELVGFFKLIKFSISFIVILLFVITGFKFILIFLIINFIDYFWSTYASMVIDGEDMEIEDDFTDLFNLLYSRLLKGTHVRLAPTLNEYIKSLDTLYGDYSHKAIRKFVTDFRNNIEIYSDDSMAVSKLRIKYKSATIINFCNLAMQSLSGVDNSDKLLAFKMELAQKQIEDMKKRAEKRVIQGRRAIWVIYAILGQFIVMSWLSKLPNMGTLSNMIGK